MAERCQLGVDQLGAITGNHIEKMDGVEGVFPVDDEKCRRLFVQKEILTYKAPEGTRRGWRIVRRVAKGLDVADGLSLDSEKAFEGRARIDPAVVIDHQKTLP